MTTAALAFLIPVAGAVTILPHSFIHTQLPGTTGVEPVYLALRLGSKTIVDFSENVGLITFPSFHAAMAVLFALAAWSHPWLRWPFALLNAIMLVATITHGGHYLVDVLAGCAIALVAWHGAGQLCGVSSRSNQIGHSQNQTLKARTM
jgi:membrane-associated phospholipid phosphatase